MIFTWDYNNLCIVFSSWRITNAFSLILSLVAVVALTAGYEAVREASRRYEARQRAMIENMPSKSLPTQNLHAGNLQRWRSRLMYLTKDEPVSLSSSERSSLLRLGSSVAAQEKKAKTVNAAFYGVQVFYSFFIM